MLGASFGGRVSNFGLSGVHHLIAALTLVWCFLNLSFSMHADLLRLRRRAHRMVKGLFFPNSLCRAVGYAARSVGCVGVLCCAAVAPPLFRVRLCSRVFWFAGTSKIMVFLFLCSHLALLIEDVILFVTSFLILPPSLADQIYYSLARLGPPHAPSAPVQKLVFIS
jgi:hypothetical protein